jgi:hypothetical protein
MAFQKYKTLYVDVLPTIGESCDQCDGGIIRQGKFSPYCSNCQTYFNLPRGNKPQGQDKPSTSAPVGQDKVMEALRQIYLLVKEQGETLKAFTAFFTKDGK